MNNGKYTRKWRSPKAMALYSLNDSLMDRYLVTRYHIHRFTHVSGVDCFSKIQYRQIISAAISKKLFCNESFENIFKRGTLCSLIRFMAQNITDIDRVEDMFNIAAP